MTRDRWWRVLDERHPRGGRVKSLVFLTHPGPSLLVTAVTIAAAGLLQRRVPAPTAIMGLLLIMLPSQLAIGALNDGADARADAVHQPYKPIARGRVSRRGAALIGLLALTVSLATAAHWSWRMLAVATLAAGAGLSYDLGLKRTPFALLSWWAGLEAVVLVAATATGSPGALASLPLSGVLALALLVGNALPDLAGDRAAGIASLPVLLGEGRGRAVAVGALLTGATYAAAAGAAWHLGRGAVAATAALGTGALLYAAAPSATLRRAGFPVLAAVGAVAAVSWLAGLPGSAAV
jgi:geranylgeranylglycerol-phosphate geranylgeranyltransferase